MRKKLWLFWKQLKKWKHYFASTSIIIRTDQQSLKYIHEQRLVDGIQHKLLIKLLGYNYKVEFKKGKENRVVDALSRVHVPLQTMSISQVIPTWIEQVTNSFPGYCCLFPFPFLPQAGPVPLNSSVEMRGSTGEAEIHSGFLEFGGPD